MALRFTFSFLILLGSLFSMGKAQLLRKKEKPEFDRPRLYRESEQESTMVEMTGDAPEVQSSSLKVQPRNNNPVFEDIGDPNNPNWPDGGLGRCQSDCDNDDQCAEDLQCFQRQGSEPVPGCSGNNATDGEDYCYDPNTPEPSATPSLAPSNAEPTVSPVPSPAPSWGPTAEPSSVPSQVPTRVDLVVLNATQRPFNKCEGECNNDGDCRGRLLCQRRGGNEFIPGCVGAGENGVNYCYDRRDGVAPPTLPSGGFRLRLYWERGYFWQETFAEARWCLRDSSPPQVRSCGGGSRFEFIYLPGEGDQIKVRGKDRCLERISTNSLAYRSCDENNVDQRWKGNWAARRFDVRPVGRIGGCMTQHHHPKSGEIVTLFPCSTAHLTDTGYWNIY